LKLETLAVVVLVLALLQDGPLQLVEFTVGR
jgi:hypothetical protein